MKPEPSHPTVSAARLLFRVPATLTLTAMLIAVGVWYGSWAQRIAPEVHHDFAHAPSHFLQGAWHRILLSLPITADPQHLFASSVMLLLCVGWLELQRGSRIATFLFFAAHVVTTITESLIVRVMTTAFDLELVKRLEITGDVGPSAGYYACLTAAIAGSRFRFRTLGLGLLILWLAARLCFNFFVGSSLAAVHHADAAHLLSALLGWLGSRWLTMNDRVYDPVA